MTLEFDLHVRAQWTGKADVYERSFASLCAGAAPLLLDAAEVTTGTKVLDVGTGPGTVARLAVERRASVAAVDAERSMVEKAREYVPDVRLGTLPDLPFLDGVFDAAVANFVINHVGDPGASVRGMRRVVRPGGTVAVTIWATSPSSHLIDEAIRAAGVEIPAPPRPDAERDFNRTEEGFAALLASTGLSDVRASTPSWTHRVDPEVWWSGPAGGIGVLGTLLAAQPAGVLAKIKQEYDRIAADRLDEQGMLAFPVAAYLASGRV
ncbi:MAG TPA: methyltransferase domain-containing protein [Micromonosporaceae bacterium]